MGLNFFKKHDMSTLIIRADVSHAPVISAIGKTSFRNAFASLFISPTELEEYLDRTYDINKLSKSIRKSNNIYLLAWQAGVPVGFAKIKRHSLNDLIEAGAQMELQKIYVLPEYHGMGAGRELMFEIKKLALDSKPDYLWLDTHITNEVAIRFYERNGFQKTGKHTFAIGTQIFEYHVMSLKIATWQSRSFVNDLITV